MLNWVTNKDNIGQMQNVKTSLILKYQFFSGDFALCWSSPFIYLQEFQSGHEFLQNFLNPTAI